MRQWLTGRLLALPQDNPIFLRELAGVRGIRTLDGMIRYTVRVLGGAVLLALLVVGGFVIFAFSQAQEGAFMGDPSYLLYNIGAVLGNNLFSTGFVPALAAVFFAIGLISNDKTANRLDLVRLAVGEQSIAEARHGLAVARTWRLTVIWLAARIAGGLMIAGAGVMALFQQDLDLLLGGGADLFRQSETWAVLTAAPLIVTVGLLFIVYSLLEPIWELRALTALGINVSTRTENRASGIALGFIGWIVMNIALSIVAGVFFVPAVAAYIWLVFSFDSINFERWVPYLLTGGYLVLPAYAGFAFYIIYLFYRTVRRRLLRNTITRLWLDGEPT